MDEFVDNHIFKLFLVHFVQPADAETEVIVDLVSFAILFCLVSQLSEVVLRHAESDSRQRQFAVEAKFIELVEDPLYVGDGGCHRVMMLAKRNTKLAIFVDTTIDFNVYV